MAIDFPSSLSGNIILLIAYSGTGPCKGIAQDHTFEKPWKREDERFPERPNIT